ncbi:hypothetical protein Tco_0818074 [Tanacetum coccineum]
MHVILFGTIPTTIPDTTPYVTLPSTHIDTALTPASPDYTPASPDYSPASDTESDLTEDPSSDHIPPLPAILPFLSLTGDSSDSDSPDTPPTPTHGASFTKMALSTQSTLVASGALRRRVMIFAHGQPIPHDHFASDDSSRDLSSSSSSETSSYPSSDDLFDSSSDHSLLAPSSGMRPSHHLCSLIPSIPRLFAAITDRPSHNSSSVSPSRKRSRSPAASVPLSSPIPGALSFACADLLPSSKRIRIPESAMNLEVSSAESFEPSRYRGTDVEMDDNVERSDGIDIDPEIQAEIDECVAYADALRARGINARVVVEAVDREEIQTGSRGPVEVRVDRVTHLVIADDIPEPVQEEGAVEVTYETLGDLVQRFHDHSEEIPVHRVQAIEKLERDNMRLRDMMDVASQRVTRSQRRKLRVQREMRKIWRFRFYDRMRIARLEAYARRHLGYRS